MPNGNGISQVLTIALVFVETFMFIDRYMVNSTSHEQSEGTAGYLLKSHAYQHLEVSISIRSFAIVATGLLLEILALVRLGFVT